MKTEKIKDSIFKLWKAIKKIVIIEKIELYPEDKKEFAKKTDNIDKSVHYADFYHTTSEEVLQHEEERIFGTTNLKEKKVYEPIDEELVNYLMQDDDEEVKIAHLKEQKEGQELGLHRQ